MTDKPHIEFLYWADCPSHTQARALLGEVLAKEGRDVPVREVEVLTEEEAAQLAFPGSPTIRVNGLDVDPDGAAKMEISLTCRLYVLEDGRFSPVPSKEMIRRALAGDQG